jgi:hypothetical protein
LILSFFLTIKIAGEPFVLGKYEIDTFREIISRSPYFLPSHIILSFVGQLVLFVSLFSKKEIVTRIGLTILSIAYLQIFLSSIGEFYELDLLIALLFIISVVWLYSLTGRKKTSDSVLEKKP